MYVYGACLFYVCCSDCVAVCEKVCCVAAVVENSLFFSLGVLKYVVCLCRGYDGCCVFCLYCEVMQMLYVCVLCASCDSSQCCVLHDLPFVNAGRGCNGPPIQKGSKRHILQAVDSSCCANCVEPPRPQLWGPIYRFLGMLTCWMAGAVSHKSGWCRDQSRSDNFKQESLDL